MHKKIKVFTKLAIIGTIWGVIYFLYVIPAMCVLFHFNFLSLAEWHEKWLAFENYNWRIRTLSDVLLFLMMVLWIPLYFVGLWIFYHIKWSIFKIKPKPKTVVQKALDLKKEKPLYAKPRAMPSAVQATKYVAPKLPGQEEEEQKQTSTKSHKNVIQMIKQMAVVARKFKVEIFQHILLEGHKVPMAISTAARAMMIEIVNRKDVNWSVDFNDDVLQSTWYSESGTMERLAEDLIKASEALAKAEPGSEVVKVICVTEGRVLNAKPTVEYFKNHGIQLLIFNNGEPKGDILDFSSFISQHFDLKEGENDPALVKLPKVELGTSPTAIIVRNNGVETAAVTAQEQVEEELPVQGDDNLPDSEHANTEPEFNSASQAPEINDNFYLDDLDFDSVDKEDDTASEVFDFDETPSLGADDIDVPQIDEDGFLVEGEENVTSEQGSTPSVQDVSGDDRDQSSESATTDSTGARNQPQKRKRKATKKKSALPRQKLKTEDGDDDDFITVIAKG